MASVVVLGAVAASVLAVCVLQQGMMLHMLLLFVQVLSLLCRQML